MDENSIVNSDVFRAINLLIDEKVGEIKWRMDVLRRDIDIAYAKKGHIDTRVSYEAGGRKKGEVELPAEVHLIKDLVGIPGEIENLDKEINGLMRLKLRLLNDCDFTHGDGEDQKKVFGPHTGE